MASPGTPSTLRELADDRLDLHKDLVPAVRQWLRSGVSEANLASGVRIQAFSPLLGGLKSEIVAGVSIEVRAVVKLGSAELKLHQVLMNVVNRANAGGSKGSRKTQRSVFPEVLLVTPVRGRQEKRDTGAVEPEFASIGTHLMLMQDLAGYKSLDSLLYSRGASGARLGDALGSAWKMLDLVHSIPCPSNRSRTRLPISPEPFIARITRLLSAIRDADSELSPMWEHSGVVCGEQCPSIVELLRRLNAREGDLESGKALCLIHGDPHAANIMMRARGRQQSVRLIDPNPMLGYSDPAYDYGKILHFLEPLGWVRHDASTCVANFSIVNSTDDAQWRLFASVLAPPDEVESTRNGLEREATENALERLAKAGRAAWILDVAIASAHLGLANTTGHADSRLVRRSALAYALRRLSRAVRTK